MRYLTPLTFLLFLFLLPTTHSATITPQAYFQLSNTTYFFPQNFNFSGAIYFQDNAFVVDNFSEETNIRVNFSSPPFPLFRLLNFNSSVIVNSSQSNYYVKITPSSKLDYFNLTAYEPTIFKFDVKGENNLSIEVHGLKNGTWTKTIDGSPIEEINLTSGVLTDTINLSEHEIIYSYNVGGYTPPTPPAGGGGGYTGEEAELGFIYNATAIIQAGEEFTVQILITVPEGKEIEGSPLLKVKNSSSGEIYGTWDMLLKLQEGNNYTFETSVILPPGEFVYWVEVEVDGETYYAPQRTITVYAPSETKPIIVWIMPPTLESHSVKPQDKITAQALVHNTISLDKAYLMFYEASTGSFKHSYEMNYTCNATAKQCSLTAKLIPPLGEWSVKVYAEVDGEGFWSIPLLWTFIKKKAEEEKAVKKGFELFEKIIPTQRGSPEKPYGKWFAGLVYLLAVASIVLRTPAGILVSVPLSVISIIYLTVYGYLPLAIGILALMGLALLGAKFILRLMQEKE